MWVRMAKPGKPGPPQNVLARVAQLAAAGWTQHRIREQLASEGLANVSQATICKWLQSLRRAPLDAPTKAARRDLADVLSPDVLDDVGPDGELSTTPAATPSPASCPTCGH